MAVIGNIVGSRRVTQGGMERLAPRAKNVDEVSQNGFRNAITDSLEKINNLQHQADELTRALLAGENLEIHQVMLATQKAALAMELTIQVRNKAIEAYQEIMRMQI